MALLTVTEAARLSRRSRTSIYRDLEKGRLDKVFTADGSLKIDSAELVRAYGPLGSFGGGTQAASTSAARAGASAAATDDAIRAVLQQVGQPGVSLAATPVIVAPPVEQPGGDAVELAVLRERLAACEHRIALLERIAQLEKAARLAADASWRERMQAKDEVIATLSNALSSEKPWPAWHGRSDGVKRAIN
ncbi:hypothetical protein IP92_04854 [Pseudoduganella flava]|uniref:Helix-turn-helix domain-containing protein n=1 Tax=Pseudoduganella flava TaxID=871742 RepID=A0A562PHU4_9BURK|nr:hypothetical protein [Pseudoduganella flava]QGZ42641.1 hypothetical protein GO485_28805 [Pseudoduganella flava]TWI43800.1 hypothetical protein IP92_04854 [Pseudoduganella flava]